MAHPEVAIILLLNLAADARYCWLVFHHKIEPALTMWLIFAGTTLLGLLSYQSAGDINLATVVLKNTVNAVDVAATWTISILLFLRTRKVKFTEFEKKCLKATAAIGVVWFILRFVAAAGIAANLTIQAVMVIAYGPTFAKLRRPGSVPTEPSGSWMMIGAANALGLGFALADPAILAAARAGHWTATLAQALPAIYAGRSVAMIALLLWRIRAAKQRAAQPQH